MARLFGSAMALNVSEVVAALGMELDIYSYIGICQEFECSASLLLLIEAYPRFNCGLVEIC